MKIQDLIDELQAIAESYGECEVRLAVQPNYPLVETLRGVAGPEDELDAMEDKDEDVIEAFATKAPVVYLVSGGQYFDTPYAPAWVFDAVN